MTSAVAVIDPMARDEDRGRRHSEETNGAVMVGAVEGVGKQLWRWGARLGRGGQEGIGPDEEDLFGC